MYLPSFLVVECPPIDLPWGTMRDSEMRVFGQPITYQCIPGLSWLDGSRLRSIMCEANGLWSSVIPPCASRLYTNVSLFLLCGESLVIF